MCVTFCNRQRWPATHILFTLPGHVSEAHTSSGHTDTPEHALWSNPFVAHTSEAQLALSPGAIGLVVQGCRSLQPPLQAREQEAEAADEPLRHTSVTMQGSVTTERA